MVVHRIGCGVYSRIGCGVYSRLGCGVYSRKCYAGNRCVNMGKMCKDGTGV